MHLGIIGAGRVGASFVLAFPSDVEGILCSTEEHTRQMARRLHAAAYTDGAELAGTAMSSCSQYATMPWLPLAGNWPLP